MYVHVAIIKSISLRVGAWEGLEGKKGKRKIMSFYYNLKYMKINKI